MVNFLPETTKVMRDDVFKVLKGRLSAKNIKCRKTILGSEWETKSLPDKQNWESVNIRATLEKY